MGKDHADTLIGQFGHKIFHACDPTTAEYASRLVGSVMQETYGGSQQAAKDLTDQMLGVGQWTGSVSQGIRPIIEPREFMVGRTSGGMVDSWVVRTGELFRDGSSCIRVSWRQAKR